MNTVICLLFLSVGAAAITIVLVVQKLEALEQRVSDLEDQHGKA